MYTISNIQCQIVSGGDFISLADGWWFDDAAIFWGATALGLAYLANGTGRHQYSWGQLAKIATISALYMGAVILSGEKVIEALSSHWA
ncbi:MAG: hypothetical protein U1E78_00650 [Gammaproteobacteria bacterium]